MDVRESLSCCCADQRTCRVLSRPSRRHRGATMSDTIRQKNKALVLDAFDTLFNKRDYTAAEKFWSPNYIQHSAHIPPGRDGLFNLIKTSPPSLRYEHGLIVAEGDFVIVHGRYSNTGLSSRTKPQESNPRVGFRCSVAIFPIKGDTPCPTAYRLC